MSHHRSATDEQIRYIAKHGREGTWTVARHLKVTYATVEWYRRRIRERGLEGVFRDRLVATEAAGRAAKQAYEYKREIQAIGRPRGPGFCETDWWEANDQRFCEAMRANPDERPMSIRLKTQKTKQIFVNGLGRFG